MTSPPPFTTRPLPPALCTGILDVHHADGHVDVDAMTAGGIVALIHKATQGRDWSDPAFVETVRRAAAHGMLVGAYHFGSNSSDGATQAEWHLSVVARLGDELARSCVLALDLEHNPDTRNGDMSTTNAAMFVDHVRTRTGRWPLLYAGASDLRARIAKADGGTKARLGACPLWLAQYGEPPRPDSIPSVWPSWSLWQYSDVGYGPRDRVTYPRDTPGVRVADRSVFRGTEQELRAWWSTCGR